MKQTEFETKLRELKQKDMNTIQGLNLRINDLKEQEASLGRRAHELIAEKKKIEQQRKMLALTKCELEKRRNEEVQQFIKDNWTEERKLSEVSDWCLVNELVSRGFRGHVSHDDKDAEFMEHLNQRFNGEKVDNDESRQESSDQ